MTSSSEAASVDTAASLQEQVEARKVVAVTGSSCLFVRDSDEENVLA